MIDDAPANQAMSAFFQTDLNRSDLRLKTRAQDKAQDKGRPGTALSDRGQGGEHYTETLKSSSVRGRKRA